jgi:hypothetical protein
MGALPALAAAGFLVASILDFSWSTLAGVAFTVPFAAVLIPAAVLAWRLSLAFPTVRVDEDGLTINHPAAFRHPLRVSRADVRSVHVRPFQGLVRPPPFTGSRWQRLRQRSRWADSGVALSDPLPVTSWYVPDLSALDTYEDRNLLIVLAHPRPMKDIARRGFGALRLIIARGGPHFTGPTRWTVARGFFARAVEEQEAHEAFRNWTNVSEDMPDPQVWQWLQLVGERKRGVRL